MTHQHTYTRTCVTLTLPDHAHRYELHQAWDCACGHGYTATSWALNTGRHLSLAEMQAVQAREKAKPGRGRR